MQEVHEFGGFSLQHIDQLGDFGDENIIEHEGDDTDDQTADGGDHGGVDAAGKHGDVEVVGVGCHRVEGGDHTGDGAKESDHRGDTGDGGKGGELLFQTLHLQLASIFDGGGDVVEGLADTGKAFLNHAGER